MPRERLRSTGREFDLRQVGILGSLITANHLQFYQIVTKMRFLQTHAINKMLAKVK